MYADDVNYCLLPIKEGIVSAINAVDSDLAQYKWSLSNGYVIRKARCSKGIRSTVRIHRIILERKLGRPLQSDEYVDHVDGDTLNNRRDNLRVASYGQNASNQRLHKDNVSGYKGVTWQNGRWKAQIRAQRVLHHLGYFDTPEEAHEAYKRAAITYHGAFARFK